MPALHQSSEPETLRSDRLRIFISYSRADLSFTDELVAGLEYDGSFEVSIDRQAIHEGENWRARLGALIASSDTIVFVLSPKSVSSPICQWEVDEAERLAKRIIPVQAEPLDGEKAPAQLGALHYVRFDPEADGRGRSFMAGLAALRRALTTDLTWLREHTRLLTRAQEWEAAGRPQIRLMSGSDISDAKEWIARRPQNAPVVSDLHLSYLKESEAAEVSRNNALQKQLNEMANAQSERERAIAIAESAQTATALWQARIAWLMASAGLLVFVCLGAPGAGSWFAVTVLNNSINLIYIVFINVAFLSTRMIALDSVVLRVEGAVKTRVIFWAIAGAVLLRIIVAGLLQQSLQIIGLTLAGGFLGLFLVWNSYKKLVADPADQRIQDTGDADANLTRPPLGFWTACGKILAADLRASFVVLLCTAIVARDSEMSLFLGLAMSIALMAIGGNAIAQILNRAPWLRWIGIMVLMYLSIDMIYTDAHKVACADYGFGCSETLLETLMRLVGAGGA